jgi:hypothetical protein
VLPASSDSAAFYRDEDSNQTAGANNLEKIKMLNGVGVRESILSSSEDGAQYANRPVSYAPSSAQYATPPHTGRSVESGRPLLPEPQSPLSPSLDVPHTAASSRSFATMAMAPPLSQAVSSQATGDSAVYTNGQNFTIAPFVLAQSGSTDGHSQRDSKISQRHSQQDPSVAGSSSSEPAHSVNPPSSVTESSGATLEPFVLPPPPRAQAVDRKGPLPTHVEEPPAPPAYSARDPVSDVQGEHGTGTGTGVSTQQTFSPTLVEYSPSSANRDSSHVA